MPALVIADLTTTTVEGAGAFDVLMRSVKAHLDEEFKGGRIKGSDYSTVYLGSLSLAMQTALSFLTQGRKIDLEAQLLEKQILLADKEVEKAVVELAILTASQAKIPAEIALLEAQAEKLIAEILNVPKQGALLDQQVLNAIQEVLLSEAQVEKMENEAALVAQQVQNMVAEKLQIEAQTALVTANTTKVAPEILQIEAQTDLIEANITKVAPEILQTTAQTSLINQQKLNAEKENLVLVAQECKLRAEFDQIEAATIRTAEETALMTQKVATERAQTQAIGVDADSVIGKQKALYTAQTSGFTRDAEQKVAKLLADTWSVRRTTDEGTVADGINKLNDATVGRAIDKLLAGIGA